MKKVVLTLSILLGTVIILTTTVSFAIYQTFSIGSASLTLFGIVLLGMSTWSTIKLSVSPSDGVQAELVSRLEGIETAQTEITHRVSDVERSAEQIKDNIKELDRRFFVAVDMVKAEEERMPEDVKNLRQKIYNRFGNQLYNQSPEKRLRSQELFTRKHLLDLSVDLPKLKSILREAGFYKGEEDDVFDVVTANAIEDFQRSQNLIPVDGIFGEGTYKALAKVRGKL